MGRQAKRLLPGQPSGYHACNARYAHGMPTMPMTRYRKTARGAPLLQLGITAAPSQTAMCCQARAAHSLPAVLACCIKDAADRQRPVTSRT